MSKKHNHRERTCDRLVSALRAAGAPEEMIQRAETGYYDDYLSTVADPIGALVRDARQHNLYEIAERAINGEFDAQSWEADEWGKSEEAQQIFDELLRPRRHK